MTFQLQPTQATLCDVLFIQHSCALQPQPSVRAKQHDKYRSFAWWLNSTTSRVSHPFFNREWFQNSNVLPVTWRERLFKVMWSVMFSKCLFMELILWNVLVWHLSNVVTTCFRIFREHSKVTIPCLQNNTMECSLNVSTTKKQVYIFFFKHSEITMQ